MNSRPRSLLVALFVAITGSLAAHAQTTATPVITLPSGSYTMPQNTTITDSTSGAAIKWCYTGTGTCTPVTAYTGTIYVDPATTETICANATASGYTTSGTACVYYTNAGSVTATPVISLGSGTYQMPQNTTITDSTSGAAIKWCYTGTGTCTPATAYTGTIYVDPATTETICANATASGHSASGTVCNYYTASSGAITFSYQSGAVTMSTNLQNATIFYTTDGSTATEASTEYYPGNPVPVSSGTVIHAVAVSMQGAGENAVALQDVQASTTGWVTNLGCTDPSLGQANPCPSNYKSFDTPGVKACGPGCGVQGVPTSVNFLTGLSSPHAGATADDKTLNVNFTAQSAGQVQILWPETGAGDGKQVCNNCLTQVQDFWVFPQSGSATITANELDMVNFVNETNDPYYGTRQLELTGALQCYATAGYWQFNGQAGSWQNFATAGVTVYKNGTALPANTQITEGCPLTGPTHIQYHDTFNPGVKNCHPVSGSGYSTTETTECIYIDYLIINNDKYTFGTTTQTCNYPANTPKCVSPGSPLKDASGNPVTESALVVVGNPLNPSWNATAFNQIQIDTPNPSGSQNFVGEYLDKDNMTASFGILAQSSYTVP